MYDRFSFRVVTNREGAAWLPPKAPAPGNIERNKTPEDLEANAGADSPEMGPELGAELGMELEGVYVISVAARLLDMHPQTLRKYERLGLINPGRSLGMLRLYSREDIRKVMLIRHLMDNLGLNLAGVEFVLNLVDNLIGMKQFLEEAAEGNPLHPVIGRALTQLFRNLNLPLEE
jgi:MerR family transcriptional regulator/heat shock protein HspR